MYHNIKSLGEKETKLIVTCSGIGHSIFTYKEAENIIGEGLNTRVLLSRLTKKGWLKPIEKGKYLIVPFEAGPGGKWSEDAFIVASHLVNPYAIAYWSALSYYNFTEQEPGTVFVQTTSRKFNLKKEILGVRYKFVKVSEHKFFGFSKIWINDKQIYITDKEKTIIDCLDHPSLCGGIIEAAKGFKNSFKEGLNIDKLTFYASKLNKGSVFKRLGYLADIFKLPVNGKYVQEWQNHKTKGYSLLDPLVGASGKFDSKWNLRINVNAQQLKSWQAT